MTPKGLTYHLSLPHVLRQKLVPHFQQWRALKVLRYEEVVQPPWTRTSPSVEIQPLLSGICGSDTGLLQGHSSPYLASLTRFPAVLGHEVVGRVVKDTPWWSKDSLVIINPALSCASLSLNDPCPACRQNHPDFCYYRGRHDLGLLIGFHSLFPGGFAQRMWVPPSQVYAIPPELPIKRAVFAEPLSIVLHGLSHIKWDHVQRILVIGSGPIGLLTLFALREQKLSPELVMAVARYPLQQQWAKRLGAEVIADLKDPAITEITGAPYPPLWNAPAWRSHGFDVVIDAAGALSSLQGAVTTVRPGGQVLLLGAAGEMHWDFTPIWSRNITVYGTYGYGPKPHQTFHEALTLLHQSTIPIEQLITHTFQLDQYRQAFKTLWDKHQGVIKVCFQIDDSSPSW
ncbi:zinc-dependent alcohol dehydrogenase [Sulfobacillus thermosulfidooxidans]|uniref:zinc-dependent alcohol dehydrogenase n=1 Tax=Sulfobacillus thermosulfidooxidans TaxID=28034 RepID=UPI00096BC228|nr:alcohol dehydrogenase catalytic domain-containing protein [Sulfobacillus thermosulfidooxidans]OLZ10346.1 hypothetical protein BFX05_10150 [Sulfobacillus thermosulfidooxidans]OLZ17397.1 hypothetical protein BFX06_13455 [Sulfobacillus thermosulfidooxidans]OLZ21093.1 hypothetical protein BFX07_13840 [Sulfobacillus thermosulfidooxidans]